MHSHSKHCKSYAGAAADATQPWGFFWQLTGHSTSSSVELKWSDAHQDAGTEKKSEDALNEMWLHFKQLKETHRQIINACNGQAKARQRKHQNAATLRRKTGHAPRHSEKGHGGRRQRRGAQGTARRSHRAEARTQENANTQKDAAQGGTATQQNKQEDTGDQHRRHAQQRARAQRKTAVPATSTRRSSDSCRVFLRGQEPQHARMRNGTNQQPSQQAMSTRLSAKQKRATREGRQSDTVHSSNAK
ncbi:hypothetical protein ERJ75_001715400 [Trypanosoma vivax]|nr:hypothetical protein ERJ75_001715400 [Trypanosoma vivax]